MSLTIEQNEWIERAYNKGFTFLQVKKKLQEAKYPIEIVEEMLDGYEILAEKDKVIETKAEKKETKKEEIEFEGKVKEFINNEDSKELSRRDKRYIKKFLKSITIYQKVMKKSLEGIKKELELLSINVEDKKQQAKETEFLKRDLIERMIESKTILDIEHPITGEDATKENLKTLNINQLIELMEENAEALQIIVNGKIE